MALNITVNGFAFLESTASAADTVKYQAFFYQNGTASSTNRWNNVRTCENTGYWNFNLGDGDFLTQDGTAINGAKVVVVFWRGDTTDRNDSCSILEEWGATEITLDGSSVYTFNTQVKSNIIPNLVWSVPTEGLVGVSYTATNGSYDVHNWNYSGTQMYHWRTRYGQDIQLINTIINTDYYWGDGNQDINLLGAPNKSHTWTTAGNYLIKIVIEDVCEATVTGTETITIKNNAPVPDITCPQAIGQDIINPNTELTFQYTGTDPDNKITGIDWVIEDDTDTVVDDIPRDDTVPHDEGNGTSWCDRDANPTAFTDSGTHKVSIVVHWHDGFTDQIINYSEDFEQLKFTGPSLDFIQAPGEATVGSGISFTNNSTDVGRVGQGRPDCHRYDWRYYEDGTLAEEIIDEPFGYVYNHTATTGSGLVQLCAYWQDGWDTYMECVEKSVVFKTTVIVTPEECYYNLHIIGTSSDGTVDGYSWDVSRDQSVAGDGSGPWELVWSSPETITQQDKKLCFTAVGYYKIQGYVHGTGATTTDYEIMYVDAVCDDVIAEDVSIIWNGTGFLDHGGDWSRGGQGTEGTHAAFAGTNGLDAVLKKNQTIQFTNGNHVSISSYDLLILQLNIQSWQLEEGYYKNLKVQFDTGKEINLDRYINFEIVNEWQRIHVPLDVFEVDNDSVNKLTFTSTGNIDIYMDDVAFAVGVIRYVAVEDVDMYGEEIGEKSVQFKDTKPSMRAQEEDDFELKPEIEVDDIGDLHITAKDLMPKMKKSFPGPINL